MRHQNNSIELDPPREKSDLEYMQTSLFAEKTKEDGSSPAIAEQEVITKKQKATQRKRLKND